MSGRQHYQNIWIVFTGKTDIAWLKFLKPGFRHCYAVINDGHKWMSVDPLSGYTDVQIYHHIEPNFDLPSWLQKQGHRVVKSVVKQDKSKSAPCMIFTCVEAVKRIIGVHKRSVITPWQLYRFLKKQSQDQKSNYSKGNISWAV